MNQILLLAMKVVYFTIQGILVGSELVTLHSAI